MARKPVQRRMEREIVELWGDDVLLSLISEGWTYAEIGPFFRVSGDLIRRYVRKHHPIARKLAFELRKRTMARLREKLEEWGGHKKVLAHIRKGRTLTAIAKEIGVNPGNLSRVMRRGKWEQQYHEAFRDRARVLVEMGIDETAEFDDEADHLDIRKAELRVKGLHWVASRDDRKSFGSNKNARNEINIGSLHLEALKAASPVRRLAPVHTEPIEEAEIEIVDEDG